MFSDFGDSYRIYRACKLVQDLTDWSVSLQSGKQANPPRPLVSPGITCSPPTWVTWPSNILMRIIRVAFFHLINLIACDGHHSTLKTLHLEIQMLPLCQIIPKLVFFFSRILFGWWLWLLQLRKTQRRRQHWKWYDYCGRVLTNWGGSAIGLFRVQ